MPVGFCRIMELRGVVRIVDLDPLLEETLAISRVGIMSDERGEHNMELMRSTTHYQEHNND